MGDRKYFAAGDYVTREPQNSSFQLLIESPFEKAGWNTRTSSPLGTTFPGTAIRFEDRYYEVLLVQSDGPSFRYYLNPWEEKFPIRLQFAYTPQQCLRELKARERKKKWERWRAFALVLSPLTGLLPAREQTLIQNEMGISATRMTSLSALLTLIPGGASIILLFVSVIAGGLGEEGVRFQFFYVIGSYLFLESLLRIYSAFKLEEPMGSVFIAIPVSIFREIFSSKKTKDIEVTTQTLPADEVLAVEGKEHDLEVVSVLPKPHWKITTGIQFEGNWYGLVDSLTLEGKEKRYKFLLKKAPDHFVFRTTTLYTRGEVNQLLRDRRRSERITWVNTFAPFWGLLKEKDQERLEAVYDFDSLKFTFITIIALALLGLFNALASISKLIAGQASRLDHLLLVPALYLLAESVVRWKRWRQGHPAGSVLGTLVRPFASPLLQ